jgi:hypothetical protein
MRILGVTSSGAFLGDYELIATALVGSDGAASVRFGDIPQNFQNLQVRYVQRPQRTTQAYAATVYLYPDNASGGGYNHILRGNGSTVASSSNAQANLLFATSIQGNGLTSSFQSGIIDILDYRSTTKNKTYRWFTGHTDSVTNAVILGSSFWNSTLPITNLNFQIDENMAQGSRISLYGIRG